MASKKKVTKANKSKATKAVVIPSRGSKQKPAAKKVAPKKVVTKKAASKKVVAAKKPVASKATKAKAVAPKAVEAPKTGKLKSLRGAKAIVRLADPVDDAKVEQQLNELLLKGKARGFVTEAEILHVFPNLENDLGIIETVMDSLEAMGV